MNTPTPIIEPSDQDVFDHSVQWDCSMLEAREAMRAELNTPPGEEVNYQMFQKDPTQEEWEDHFGYEYPEE